MTHCQHIDIGDNAVLQGVNVLEPSGSTAIQVFPIGVDNGGTADGIVDRGAFGPGVSEAGTVENSFVSIITFTGAGGVAVNDTASQILAEGYTQGGLDNDVDATVTNSIATKFWAFSINQDGPNDPGATAQMTPLSYYVGDDEHHAAQHRWGVGGQSSARSPPRNQAGPREPRFTWRPMGYMRPPALPRSTPARARGSSPPTTSTADSEASTELRISAPMSRDGTATPEHAARDDVATTAPP